MTNISLTSELEAITRAASDAFSRASTLTQLEAARVEWLGKKSRLQAVLGQLGSLSLEEKKIIGPAANRLKGELTSAIESARERLEITADHDQPQFDISLPRVWRGGAGHLHPTQIVLAEIYEIFQRLGFSIVEGPEIETDWYNFEVLNMPADHPAREMQDTFYVKAPKGQPSLVPRTHTSASQIRYMESHKPPFKIIVPGKAYRNEDEDRTHLWSFYQVEGLVVGAGVSVTDLKGTLLHTMQSLFGQEAKIRLRPSYFPYTEPSFEVDVWYRDEWLEIGGAGMVHPDVLRRGGVDPDEYSGFAFGFGPDRITIIRYGLDDIRVLWRPNLRVSEQT